jgi:hypothetical protein
MYLPYDDMSPNVRRRVKIEENIVRHIVADLLKAGFYLSVDDGGDEFAIKDSRDEKAILDALMNTNEDLLYADAYETNVYGGSPYNWVRFVYGNDGWDVVNDYTGDLSGIIEPITDAAENGTLEELKPSLNPLRVQEAVDDLLGTFDFHPVQRYMESVGWKYFHTPNTPSVDDLKSMAGQVLQTVCSEANIHYGHSRAATGGFEARLDMWETSTKLTLSFIPFRKEVTL